MINTFKTVTEPKKNIPVIFDVDVVVAGGGCSGIFAALAAGKGGARTVLIERMGVLGGNCGPGMIFGCVNPFSEGYMHLPGGNKHIVKMFEERVEDLRGNTPPSRPLYSSLFTHVAIQMLEEAEVKLLIPAYAADPIIDNGVIKGIFAETKSGRVAIKSKVIIDATGEADVAMRAGASMIRKVESNDEYYPAIVERYHKDVLPKWNEENWNEAGLVFTIGDINWDKYKDFIGNSEHVTLCGLPQIVAQDKVPLKFKYPAKVNEKLQEAAKENNYFYAKEIKPGAVMFWQYRMIRLGLDTGESAITVLGDFEIDNCEHVSMLEAEMRKHAYDSVEFLRKYVPGCENAYVLCMSNFIGTRGGPFIEGEYVLSPQDIITGKRHDDVIMRGIWEVARFKELKEQKQYTEFTHEAMEGYDIPYRVMLPKDIDNILTVGRGASYIRRGHDPATRSRIVQFHLGQVAGMAALQAIRDNTSVKCINIKKLQKSLIEKGYYLGDEKRIAQLGLV